MNYKMFMFGLAQIRKVSTSLNRQKNHYDSLGIAKNATQADIKSAYYKLSKVYHPDKNQGHTQQQRDQHAENFKNITEAYEVLGNVRTRKMYDKGFLGVSAHPEAARQTTPDDPLHNFYRSRERRTRPPPPGGRQPIYDFDEWTKQHYGEAVKKARDLKARRAFYAEQRQDDKESKQQESMVYIGILLILMCTLFKASCESDIVRSVVGKEPLYLRNDVEKGSD